MQPYKNRNRTGDTFSFEPVTVNEVFKQLKGLKWKKGSRVNDLPPGSLKDVAIYIAKPLSYIINLCLETGTVPEDFKIGKVTPVYKSGSKHVMNNYRPITMLPICSKILERCVHSQLMKYLKKNELLSKNEFGFCQNRSTEIAAMIFLDSIRKNMDAGKMTGAIFIDLGTAFDTLSHSQILNNLNELWYS